MVAAQRKSTTAAPDCVKVLHFFSLLLRSMFLVAQYLLLRLVEEVHFFLYLPGVCVLSSHFAGSVCAANMRINRHIMSSATTTTTAASSSNTIKQPDFMIYMVVVGWLPLTHSEADNIRQTTRWSEGRLVVCCDVHSM